MTTTQTYSYIGTTDECVECQLCGKADLRSTVVLGILDTDGNVEDVTYYGSTCAARTLGSTDRDVLAKARAAHRTTMDRAEESRRLLDVYGAVGDYDLRKVALTYRRNNNQGGQVQYPLPVWQDMAADFIARAEAAIKAAELISHNG